MQIDFSEGQRENRSLSKSTCIVKYLYRQIPKRSIPQPRTGNHSARESVYHGNWRHSVKINSSDDLRPTHIACITQKTISNQFYNKFSFDFIMHVIIGSPVRFQLITEQINTFPANTQRNKHVITTSKRRFCKHTM